MHAIGGILALALTCAIASPSQAQSPTLIPVKVGVLKIAGLANAYAAKVEKMFERNGLDVTLIEFRSGAEAVSAQQGGSVDFALSLPGTAMTANERGFEFLAIFQNEIVYDKGPDSGSVQSLVDSNIKSLKDLVGKRVATILRPADDRGAICHAQGRHRSGQGPAHRSAVSAPSRRPEIQAGRCGDHH